MIGTRINGKQFTLRGWGLWCIFRGPPSLAVILQVPTTRLNKMENFFSMVAHVNVIVTENNPDLLFLRTLEF